VILTTTRIPDTNPNLTVTISCRTGRRLQTKKKGNNKLANWGKPKLTLATQIQTFCRKTFGGAMCVDYNLAFVMLHSKPFTPAQADHCDLTGAGWQL